MAARAFAAVTGQIATGTSAKTLLQVVAGSNHALRVQRLKVSFEGTDLDAAPVQVRVLRQTTAGTMSALTPVKLDDSGADALDVTAQHTATAEPTAGDLVDALFVHATSGYELVLPLGQEIVIGAGDRLGIEVTAAADVDAIATLHGEE